MYATITDITNRYGEDELWSMVGEDDSGQLKVDVIDRALSDATEEINIHLRKRYTLPLVNVDKALVRLCVDLAVANLPVNAMGESELVTERAKAARKLLAQIGKGDVQLDVDENTTESNPGNVLTYNESSPLGNLKGF